MNNKRLSLLAIATTLAFLHTSAQALPFEGFTPASSPEEALRICFYNVENLFDTQDDTLTRDEEFLPEGRKGWNDFRYREKLTNTAKTLLAVGYENPPAMIGLCEIENRKVMEDLARHDLMQPFNYRVVHFESPDRRGIDVGLLMQREHCRLLSASVIRLRRDEDEEWVTRDVLYAKVALLPWADTAHVFVNHWPSRRGGEEASRPLRLLAAKAVKEKVDSVQQIDPLHGIVIMGDLNDGVGDASLVNGLEVVPRVELSKGDLYDAMSALDPLLGTHKYRGHWAYLDHFVINQAWVHGQGRTIVGDAKVFRADWLLGPDDRYTGEYPKRTYAGPRYLGGYSDHLPIYLDLFRLMP